MEEKILPNKKIMMLTVILAFFLAVSAVSANDANDTAMTGSDASQMKLSSGNGMIGDNLQIGGENPTLTHVDSTYNQLKLENDNEKLSVLNDEDNLSSAETFNGTAFSELQSKINSLNNGDVLDLTNNVTQNGASHITISKSITINGNGITIDAKGKSRIFYINGGATVVLNNITFTNGYQREDGGAIYNENAKVTITGSQFIKNTISQNGGAINNKGTMNIAETCFIANKASWDGGAIYNTGNINIADSYFINSTVNNGGGAIYNFESNMNITHSNFINNIAGAIQSYSGGAIYNFYSNVNIACSNFIDNTANRIDGGAIYNWGREINIVNSSFIANKAITWDGGAISNYDGHMTITNSLFINNTARHGGAIYNRGNSNAEITNCVFINNKATEGNHAYTTDSQLVINDNWWDTNDPVWNNLIYGNKPSSYAVLNVNADNQNIPLNSKVKLNYAFYRNGTGELLSIPTRPIILSATGGQLDNTSGNLTEVFSTEFSCDTPGDYEITAIVDNQEIKNTVSVAMVWYVNATAAPGGNGKSDSTAFKTLKEALDAAAEDHTIIRIASGTYTGTDNIGLNIDKKLSLEKYGDGEAIFDAQGLNRILTVNVGSVNISGLTFKNGKYAGDGGAIYFNASGKVENCNFINNNASGGHLPRYQGGAIYFKFGAESYVTNCNFTGNIADNGGAVDFEYESHLTNCNFVNNIAENSGAAVCIDATIGEISNCTFINNSCRIGGALYIGNSAEFTNCKFINNTAYNGGAIQFMGDGKVTDCTFSNNMAENYGGAIRFYNGNHFKTYIVTNCNFTNNTAKQWGGALQFEYNGNVTNCTFTNNKAAKNGGAIFIYMGNTEITGCNFTYNSLNSTGYGGAVYFETSGKVENCNFIKNTALLEGTSRSAGGAIYFKSGAESYVTTCNFTGNIADIGGAVNFEYKSHLTNCNFVNNAAGHSGAAVCIDAVIGEISNCTFINNKADGPGGAIYIDNNAEFTNCKFINNTAYNGGAIQFMGEGKVTDCTFSNNTAKNYGGAIRFYNGNHFKTYNVINCNFTNNTAKQEGGALYFEYNGNVTNCTFTNNKATNNGGAAYFRTDGEVNDCTFVNNNATSSGGALYFLTNSSVANCNFTGNTAVNGGAVFFSSNGDVTNCNFVNNSAGQGGALYFITTGSIGNCNFTGNTADVGGAIKFSSTNAIENCNFTDNSALYGGAVFFSSNGTVANCKFTGNDANTGSAIYFYNNESVKSIVSNSYFLNNRANVDDDPFILNLTGNNAEIIFIGRNNLINAIYSDNDCDVSFSNVTYWGARAITNTDIAAPVKSTRQAGQNITVKAIVNGNLLNMVIITDEEGKIVIKDVEDYLIIVRHDEDSYYTEAEEIFKNMQIHVNVTSQTTHNKTVNITAESNIPNEIVEGRLVFILSGGIEINATYASNGTWWAVYTFDNYTEYNVNASFTGLDNTTVNNATVNITKADSTINLDNITLNYGDSINLTITTEGAIEITADINGNNVPVINKFTIPISGLDAGNYTLTVTAHPDEDHNPVTKIATITVNKLATEIILTNETLDLKAKDIFIDFAALTPADAGALNYTSSNDDIVKIENGKIIAVEAGKATITVSFAGNDNYMAAESKNITVTVTTLDASVRVIQTEYLLTIGDETYIIANTDPKGLVIDYATDDTNIVSVDDYGHITALGNGTATIFVSVGDNHVYKYDVVNVTVSVKIPTEIILANETLDLKANDKYHILANLTPADAGNLTFTSSDTTVVTVDDEGNVEAIGGGKATITISFAGNDNYTAAKDAFVTVTVSKLDTAIDVNVSVDDNDVVITAEVDSSANGLVEFNISGKTVYVAVNEGKAVYDIVLLTGDYNVDATYLGDSKFNANRTSKAFTVKDHVKQNTTLVPNVVVDSSNVTITVAVNRNATGFIKFDINGNELFAEVNGGKAVLNTILPVGNYTVSVAYLGDDEFNENATMVSFSVAGHESADVNVTIPSDIPVGDNVTVKVDIPDATGNVTVYVGGEEYVAQLVNGSANVGIPGLSSGNHTVVVEYTGDDKYAPFTKPFTLNIPKTDIPEDELKVNETLPIGGKTPAITIKLPEDATGYVLVSINGYEYHIDVNNGTANITLPALSYGKHDAKVTYPGDGRYNSVIKNITINVPEPNVTANDVVIRYSDNGPYRIHVAVDGKAVSGQYVTINFNGKTYKQLTNSNGDVLFKIPAIKPNTYTITAKYNDVSISKKIKISNIIVVKTKKIKKSSKKVKIKVKLMTVKNKYLKSKKLTLKINGKNIKAKTNRKGVAVFKLKKSIVKKLKAGKRYKVKVSFGKDAVTKKIKIRR